MSLPGRSLRDLNEAEQEQDRIMTDQKYTIDGLPVVKLSIVQQLQEEQLEDRLSSPEVLERIKYENPFLYAAFGKLRDSHDPSFIVGVRRGFIFVYEALRRQSANSNGKEPSKLDTVYD